jgi:oxygen-independent coproporphyrinogen-3 oxidase
VNRRNNSGVSVYIHIPFCLKKCNYCDFVSFSHSIEGLTNYVSYLKKEIDIFFLKFPRAKVHLRTLYLGGGTPSLLNVKLLLEIVDHLKKYFDFSTLIEFTIEANPETIKLENFRDFKEIGVNRVSIGGQSFNDATLRKLGRLHDSEKIYKSFELLRKCNFDNINLDLMFALPGENLGNILHSLSEAVKLEPEHISFYSLTVERGTKFYRVRKSLEIPSNDDQAEQYKKGINFLQKNGYKQYEISNFAKKGYECAHNLSYWLSSAYAGFGVSAGSFISRRRRKNVVNLETYYRKIDSGKNPVGLKEHLIGKQQKGEYIIMCLRLNKGCLDTIYYDRFGVFPETDFAWEIKKLVSMKLIETSENGFRITPKGLLIANQVMEYFI